MLNFETQQKIIIPLESYLSKDSMSMFSRKLGWTQTSYLHCKLWRIFRNCLLVSSYDRCLQDLSLCRVLPLPQGLHDIFAQIELCLFSSIRASLVCLFFFFSLFLLPCCHFSAISNVSQCFNLPNNGVLWCFLCLTCLWSPCFSSSVGMWFGFLSVTLSCRLAP